MEEGPTEAPEPRPDARRIWIFGAIASVLAAATNELVRRGVIATLSIPAEFMPLSGGSPILFSLLGGLGATATLWLIARRARRPWRTFVIVAFATLAVSWLPDIGLLASRAPGATPTSVGVLMVMHVVAFAIIMGFLWAAAKPPSLAPAPPAPGAAP